MPRKFDYESLNDSQKQGVDAKKGNVLISAGAGSGKTAVLTGRVFKLLNDGDAKLDELLVLTFTEKAAFEMKQRVREYLEAEPGKEDLLNELDQAQITTFDAFALSLVRKYHYEIGLDKEPSIGSASLFAVEKKRIIEKTIERHILLANENEDPKFLTLLTHYAPKDLKNIIASIEGVLAHTTLIADKEEFFAQFEENYFSEKAIDGLLGKAYQRGMEWMRCFQTALEEADDAAAWEKDSAYFSQYAEAKNFDELRLAYGSMPTSKPSIRHLDLDSRARRDAAFKVYWNRVKALMAYPTSEKIKEDYESLKEDALTLVSLAKEVDEVFDQFKRGNALFDFSDIAAMASQVASLPEIQKKLQKQYKFIMIDEYQDTNRLQENFIKLIAQDNVFCVGDMKQAIYGFRNADPTLFLEKYNAYEHGRGGKLITMDYNYRSRKEVLQPINDMFNVIMTERVGGIDFLRGQSLRQGAKDYDLSSSLADYNIQVLCYPNDVEDRYEHEARLVASDIAKKLRDGFPIPTGRKKEDGSAEWKKAQPEDFTILCRDKSGFDTFQRVFNEYQIPVEVTGDEDIFGDEAVAVTKSLVEAYVLLGQENPDLDRLYYDFVSLRRSFLRLYPFPEVRPLSDGEIWKAKDGNAFLSDPFLALIRDAHARIDALDLSTGFAELVSSFFVLDSSVGSGRVKAHFQMIESLSEAIENGRRLGWGWEDVLAYLSDFRRYGIQNKLKIEKADVKAVQLMTIHASKGLDANIVYLARMDKGFKYDRLGVFSPTFRHGLAMKDCYGKINLSAHLEKVFQHEKIISEENRLLYVALTRARNQIILLHGYDPTLGKDVWAKEGPKSLESVNSFDGFFSFVPFASEQLIEATPTPPSAFSRTNQQQGVKEVPIWKELSEYGSTTFPKRASKTLKDPIDEGVLLKGTRLHRLLELCDFKTKDVSWIDDPEEQSLIYAVLHNELFAHSEEAVAYKEYRYFDEKDASEKVIDLFLRYPDHIDLIDYKTSNIDSPEYAAQLDDYRTYLLKAFHLPVKAYLLSIAKNQVKGVD